MYHSEPSTEMSYGMYVFSSVQQKRDKFHNYPKDMSRCKRVHNFTRQSNFHEIFFLANSLIFNQDEVFFHDIIELFA